MRDFLARAHLRADGPVVPVEVRGPRGVARGRALFDTGAEMTLVLSRIVDELGLPLVGFEPMDGATGHQEQSKHSACLSFPTMSLPVTCLAEVASAPQIGNETHPIDVLVGRDLLDGVGALMLYDAKAGRFSVVAGDREPVWVAPDSTGPQVVLAVGLGLAVALGVAVYAAVARTGRQ